jgi:hypothetical protein
MGHGRHGARVRARDCRDTGRSKLGADRHRARYSCLACHLQAETCFNADRRPALTCQHPPTIVCSVEGRGEGGGAVLCKLLQLDRMMKFIPIGRSSPGT